MRQVDLVPRDLTLLTVDWDVGDAGVGPACFLVIALRFEAYLVVEEDDELALEPLLDFLLALTDSRLCTLAHLELDGKLLCSD